MLSVTRQVPPSSVFKHKAHLYSRLPSINKNGLASRNISIMSWSTELDTAIDLYNAEDHKECIAQIRSVYRDNTPNYARVRYSSLLACCLDDWDEAEV